MSKIIYDTTPKYYVYTYHNEDDTIFYIGKGQGNRIHSTHDKHIPVPKDEQNRRLLKEHLTEEEAFELEKEQIKLHGRLDLNTGILLNRTNGGGVGSSGYKHTPATLQKLREANSGTNHPNYGKKHSEATLLKISKANSGTNHPNYGQARSEETKKKCSEANIGEKNPNYGKKLSPATLQKLREAMSGENHPNYGKKHSPETISKMKETWKRKLELKMNSIIPEI